MKIWGGEKEPHKAKQTKYKAKQTKAKSNKYVLLSVLTSAKFHFWWEAKGSGCQRHMAVGTIVPKRCQHIGKDSEKRSGGD